MTSKDNLAQRGLPHIHIVYRVLLGSILMGLAFIYPHTWIAVFFGAMLLISATLESTLSSVRMFFLLWIAGSIIQGLGHYGLYWDILPLDWLGFGESRTQYAFVTFTFIYTAISGGFVYGFWGILVRALRTKSHVFNAVLISSIWVLTEVGASVVLYFQGYGSGAPFFQINHTFGYIGYQLAGDIALLQLATLGSVYILSFVIILVASISVSALQHHTKQWYQNRYSYVLIFFGVIWIATRIVMSDFPDNATPYASYVDVSVLSSHMYGQNREMQLRMQQSLIADKESRTIIVLPEGAEFFTKLSEFGQSLPKGHTVIIDSNEVHINDALQVVRAEIYDAQQGTSEYRYKYFLLPIGEYVPSVIEWLANTTTFGGSHTYRLMHTIRQFVPYTYPEPVTVYGDVVLGTLFCNESASPTEYRHITNHGAQLLINMSSHLWFHQSRLVFARQKQIAQVRAVENRRWYAQANNMAPAFVLNQYGRTVAQSEWVNSDGVLQVQAPLLHEKTIYTRFGPWVLVLPILVVLIALFLYGVRSLQWLI